MFLRSKLKRNDSVRTQKSIKMLDANMRLLGEIQVKRDDGNLDCSTKSGMK